MQNIEVKSGQNLFDIALQYLGDVTGVIGIAELNSLSITGQLIPGQLVKLPAVINTSVVNEFKKNNTSPASSNGLSIRRQKLFAGALFAPGLFE